MNSLRVEIEFFSEMVDPSQTVNKDTIRGRVLSGNTKNSVKLHMTMLERMLLSNVTAVSFCQSFCCQIESGILGESVLTQVAA